MVGGSNHSDVLSIAELYDPSNTASVLLNRTVLVTGGHDQLDYLSTAELYDLLTGTWSSAENMTYPRIYYTASVLPSGTVLVAGGDEDSTVL